jgi:hypothetical protein
MVAVTGEALIDLLIDQHGHLGAQPGGGPLNTARRMQVGREYARSPWLPWSLSVLSTAEPGAYRSGLSSGLHCPALPDMDFRDRASSNLASNIVRESGSTDFVEDLVRLQAKAAADDLLLDLGGAAEETIGPRCRLSLPCR